MKPIFAWSLSGAGGILLGYLLAIRPQGDFWLGSVLIIAAAIALYGTIQFPEHFFRSPLVSGSNIWLFLISMIAVLAIALPRMGPIISETTPLPIVACFGALWLGGASAGIALERRTNPE